MVDLSISENLLRRYCLSDEVQWWFSVEEPIEYDCPITHTDFIIPGSDGSGIVIYFDVEPANLEKRTRAIVELLEDPGRTEKYIRNMATKLQIKCINAGRRDLSAIISAAKSASISPEEKRSRLARREHLKEKMAEMF